MAQMELVNGYRCYNCTDVDYAKRNIDPAHPKDGPYGVNATDDPRQAGKASSDRSSDPWGASVVLGGSLDQPGYPDTGAPAAPGQAPAAPGQAPASRQRLDISV